MPRSWQSTTIVPLHKKGDITECNNFRGISLLAVIYKVVLAILMKTRIESVVDPQIVEYQAEFRNGRGTKDQIFSMKEVLMNCYEYKISAMVLFIDYDYVSRKQLLKAMREFGVSPKLVNLTRMTLKLTTGRVKVNGKLSDSFEIKTGLRQADPLSTLLFNIVFEKIIRMGNLN